MDDLKLYRDNKDQLIQAVRIFSQDIKTSFGFEKCAVLEMRRGRRVDSSGINLPDDQYIGEIPWHFTVGLESQHQDEGENNIGVYQKSQEVM